MTNLQEFAPDVWTVEGPNVYDMGFLFTTRMTVVKLSDGSVWIESPVAASFATLAEIAAVGPVRYLVAATPRHVWRLERWHTLFPEAELWSAPHSLLSLEPAGLPLNRRLGAEPPPAWAADLDQLPFRGNPLLTEVLFLHRQARTLIVGDLFQSNPSLPGHPLRNALLKLSGGLAPGGGVGFDMKLTFIQPALARQARDRLLAWDFDKLIIAHGACITHDAKPLVASWLSWIKG